MRFYQSQINKLAQSIKDKKIHAVLLYGPDSGVRDKIFDALQKNLGLEVKNISLSTSDDKLVCTLLQNRNLFNSRYLIKITDINKFSVSLKDILLQDNLNFPVIIAPQLKTSSALYKFFNAEKMLACIGCYEDDRKIKAIIEIAKEFGKTITPEAASYIESNISGDSALVRGELAKLCSGLDSSVIDLETARQIGQSNFAASLDDLFFALARNKTGEFLSILKLLKEEKYSDIAILHSMGRYWSAIYRSLCKMEAGISLDSASAGLSPPIFYKYLPAFKNLLGKSNLNLAASMLQKINDLEIISKQGMEIDFFMDLYKELHKGSG